MYRRTNTYHPSIRTTANRTTFPYAGPTRRTGGTDGSLPFVPSLSTSRRTLISVFFPTRLHEGTTGRLFREFSLVVSGSVLISTFAALTVTPMLATKLLVRQERKSWFYNKTEPFFVGLNNFYSRSLAAFLRRRWIALPLVGAMVVLIGLLWSTIPTEMAPLEDRSQIAKKISFAPWMPASKGVMPRSMRM